MKNFSVAVFFCFCVSYGMMAGGKKLQPLSFLKTEKVLKDGTTLGKFLDDAIVNCNRKLNSMYYHTIAEGSLKVYSQLVQGKLYTIDATMVPTTCRKGDGDMLAKDLKKCELLENGFTEPIEFTIWVREWLKDPERVIVDCGPPRSLPAK